MMVRPNKLGIHVFEGGTSHLTERVMDHEHMIVTSYHDVEHFWETGNTIEPTTERASSRKTHEPKWSGTPTWEDAVELGVNGWPDGLKKIDKIFSKLGSTQAMVHGTRKAVKRNVHGSRVDVPRAMTGDPYCMIRRKPVRTSDGNHIKVAVNVVASANVEPEEIIARGAAVCALISKLESDGYSTELIAFECSTKNDGKYIFHVPVKRPEDFLNRERVAMMLGHPASLRRGFFAAAERTPKGVFDEYFGYGYGTVGDLTSDEAKILGYTTVIKSIKASESWTDKSPEQMSDWIMGEWKKAVENSIAKEGVTS